MRKTIDGQSAILEFGEGCSLVLQNLTEPKWIAIPLPETMSDEIRARDGDLSIADFRDGDDIAIIVLIGDDTLAYCSTVAAQRFLARQPTVLFTE